MSLPISASDTSRYRANRVLYTDRVIQETALKYGLRNSIAWEGEPGKKAGSNIIFGTYVNGMLETTPEERETYIASVSPTIPPYPPRDLSVLVGNQTLIVFFSSSVEIPIDSYTVTVSPGDFVVSGTSSPILVTGITNGVSYTVSVVANNAAGSSSAVSLSVDSTYTFTLQYFTSVGSDTWVAPDYVTSVEYLVVGGGGGGGGGYNTGGGGGGGGGMVLTGTVSVVSGTSYTVTVGSGGAASTNSYPIINETSGGSGSDSSFDTILALGGRGGLSSRIQTEGSGYRGSAQVSDTTAPTGGSGGGNATTPAGGSGGGGGGAVNGTNGTSAAGGSGGAGTTSSISGSSITYGTGGAGAKGNTITTGATGTANRGNGGGGGGYSSAGARNGGAGGSGIVILKY